LSSDNQFSEKYIEATLFRFRKNIQAHSMLTAISWSQKNYWNRKNIIQAQTKKKLKYD
jgi:hypothetical protein